MKKALLHNFVQIEATRVKLRGGTNRASEDPKWVLRQSLIVFFLVFALVSFMEPV